MLISSYRYLVKFAMFMFNQHGNLQSQLFNSKEKEKERKETDKRELASCILMKLEK